MPRPAAAAELHDDPDTFARPSRQTITTVTAVGVQKPKGARNSAFDTGARPKRTWRPLPPIDINAVQIVSGRPLPRSTHIKGEPHPMLALLQRMKPGDMVELSNQHGKSMRSMARNKGYRVVTRQLDDDTMGVWLLDPPQAVAKPPKAQR